MAGFLTAPVQCHRRHAPSGLWRWTPTQAVDHFLSQLQITGVYHQKIFSTLFILTPLNLWMSLVKICRTLVEVKVSLTGFFSGSNLFCLDSSEASKRRARTPWSNIPWYLHNNMPLPSVGKHRQLQAWMWSVVLLSVSHIIKYGRTRLLSLPAGNRL